jgi:hypothetical protein
MADHESREGVGSETAYGSNYRVTAETPTLSGTRGGPTRQGRSRGHRPDVETFGGVERLFSLSTRVPTESATHDPAAREAGEW